ncbi:MAG TPA: AraC family transcriptional regulator, partial [Caulobacteraceae bacterium]|nr:AraC family transcriptional regulator [Caulobacteraceae bacterium]
SGLVPHVFRSPGATASLQVGRLETRPMSEAARDAAVELVIGVAPNESLALGSLMVGPVLVRREEHPDLSRRLWNAVAMLEDEYADASWINRNLVIRRLAEIMMVNISRRLFADRRRVGGAPASRNVMLAIDAFLREPERAWTLAELARAAGMSRTRFIEEFKLVTGQSPGRIVSRMRLTSAAHRLARERLSVEAAADEAGYSSSAAFVRAFQREFGETPARWRRRQAVFPNIPPRASPSISAMQGTSAR